MTLFNEGAPWVQWSVACAAALIAASTDVQSRRIPNWLTLPLLVGGLMFAFVIAGGPGLADAAAACLLLALPYVLLYALAGGGAGDAKLMAALGAWLGIVNGLLVLGCVALCGVIQAIVVAVIQRRTKDVATNVAGWTQGVMLSVVSRGRISVGPVGANSSEMAVMPYGVAIFVGVCISATGVLLWRV